MIISFKHKGLKKLYTDNKADKLPADLLKRIRVRINALEAAETVEDLNLPGFDFHKLQGKPVRYSIHVNGPWCMTFEWETGGAVNVDLENYH